MYDPEHGTELGAGNLQEFHCQSVDEMYYITIFLTDQAIECGKQVVVLSDIEETLGGSTSLRKPFIPFKRAKGFIKHIAEVTGNSGGFLQTMTNVPPPDIGTFYSTVARLFKATRRFEVALRNELEQEPLWGTKKQSGLRKNVRLESFKEIVERIAKVAAQGKIEIIILGDSFHWRSIARKYLGYHEGKYLEAITEVLQKEHGINSCNISTKAVLRVKNSKEEFADFEG